MPHPQVAKQQQQPPCSTLCADSPKISADEGNELQQAPITSVVANVEDLELAVAKKDEDTAPRRRCFRSWPSTRRGKACGFCMLLLAVAVAVCLPLFWPKDPSWKLTKLDLDEAVLREYQALFFAAIDNTLLDNATLPEFKLTAEIDLDNPNYLGGTMLEPGEFAVSYKGHDFGTGSCTPATIRASSTTPLRASIKINMWPQIFRDIVSDIMAHGFNLTVQVRGGTKVQGPLGIHLPAGSRCIVHTAVANIYMNTTRAQVVSSQECGYWYF